MTAANDAVDASVDPAQQVVRTPDPAGSQGTDGSHATVQHGPRVEVVKPFRSNPFRDLPNAEAETDEETAHAPLRPPSKGGTLLPPPATAHDRLAQNALPVASMPVASHNFHGQGSNIAACSAGSCATPPDTNGAVGPSHYVQTTNINGQQGLAIWDKSGTLLSGPKRINTLFSSLGANDPCASRDDGDPVVIYDQLADRWFITQFALPNTTVDKGPSYQCVAVSQTPDPTGAYYLYEFSYPYAINDYGKFGIWRDAYYATINAFGTSNTSPFKGDDFCAYDRASMLTGAPASQQCFLQAYPANSVPCGTPPYPVEPFSVFGALPVSLDGPIPPPAGEPGLILQFDYSQCGPTFNQLDLWKFHVDWQTPGNSTVTGPTVLNVNAFTPTCYANNVTGGTGFPNCVPQPGTTVTLDGIDDRMMFRLAYRNFGQYESVVVNHSVVGGNGTGGTPGTAGSGIRWYEIQLQPGGGSPTIAQQSTYAPADKNWRWMGSIAQDQAGDFALGFAISSDGTGGGVSFPGIGWTGRTNADPLNTMGQAESIIDTGSKVEADAYPASGGQPDEHRGRWGDYSNMTIDPSDDCTFWYTQELYDTTVNNPVGNWDTYIASAKFPNCAAKDFSLSIAPSSRSVAQGGSTTYTVTVTKTTAGAGEAVSLYVQDLPAGVTLGSFNPATVPAGGGTSTLTLDVSATATLTGTPAPSFTVIGKATSAVHQASAQIAVVPCGGSTEVCCPPSNTCSSGLVCSGGTCVACGGAGQPCCGGNTCAAPNTCGGGGTAGVCGCTSNGKCNGALDCGMGTDNCGNTIACGTCSVPQTCGGGGTPGMCGCTSSGKCTSGNDCGTGVDNCGTTISCGTCSAPQTCGGSGVAGKCGCTSNGKCTSGATCGMGTDNCGNTISCGSCAAPQTCGGGGMPGACGCTSSGKCASGNTCGMGADNCGNVISCGTCTAPETCGGGGTPGQCGGGTTMDAGGGDGGGPTDGGAEASTDAGGKDAGGADAGGTDAGGADAGNTDAGGTDAGGTVDSGAPLDAGNPTDAGGATDAGRPDAATGGDAGSAHDAGASSDGALGDGSGDLGNGLDSGSSGCGCVTAGADDAPSSRLALGGLGGLALLGVVRVRRRRRG